MIRWNSLLIVSLLNVALGACSGAMTAPLGSGASGLQADPAAIDLYTCLGTPCDTSGLEPRALVIESATRELEEDADLEVRWQRELPTACAEIAECQVQSSAADAFRISADGSIWFAAAVSSPPRDGQLDGAYLGVFGADGRSLGGMLIDQETSNLGEAIDYGVSLAKVEDDHAVVAINKYELREGEPEPTHTRWLTETELWPTEPAEPLTLSPPRDVWAMYPPPIRAKSTAGGVLLAPSEWGDGSIALIDPVDREPLWVQTRNGSPPIDALEVDAEGRTTIFTSAPWNQETYLSTPRIEHYDANGQLTWIRSLPAPWDGPLQRALAVGSDGSIILTMTEEIEKPLEGQPGGFEVLSGARHVVKINTDGDLLWAIKLPPVNEQGWSPGTSLAVDPDGNIFIPGDYYFSEEPTDLIAAPDSGQFLLEISPDGERVRAHRIANANLESLAFADNGDLYFLGYTFGRLTRRE